MVCHLVEVRGGTVVIELAPMVPGVMRLLAAFVATSSLRAQVASLERPCVVLVVDPPPVPTAMRMAGGLLSSVVLAAVLGEAEAARLERPRIVFVADLPPMTGVVRLLATLAPTAEVGEAEVPRLEQCGVGLGGAAHL